MTNKFDKNLPTVYTNDNGQHMVMMPNGSILPVWATTVRDETGEAPMLTAELRVNLAKDKEDALEKYKKGR